MRFVCPFCSSALTVEDMLCGSRVICNSCDKTVMVPAGRLHEGCIVGDFVINSKLGSGSIGVVFKATQISLDRVVALKILTLKHKTERGMNDFLREARSAAKLSHANLVQSYAVGEDEGYVYMAMTYVTGETLKTRLKREQTIPPDEALHIVQQVAEALYYAWDEARLIHRDVKPDNIMITDGGIVKLTDLGLAMNQSEWKEDMEISGSPSYMSPEQFAGEKLDTRSDIYSLGVTLYQMLSGRLPFEAETVTSIARQHFEDTPPPLNQYVLGLNPKIVSLVRKMMAKNAGNRFQNMDELLKAVWNIRQKTAPNKSMVPDVHTISIKRLNYEIQNESIAKKSEERRHSSSTFERFRFMLLLLPPLIIFAVAGAILYDNYNQQDDAEISHAVSVFERLAEDRMVPYEQLSEEAEKLIAMISHKSAKSDAKYQYLSSHINYLLLQRKGEPLQSDEILLDELGRLREKYESLLRENRQLRSQLEAKRSDANATSAVSVSPSSLPATKSSVETSSIPIPNTGLRRAASHEPDKMTEDSPLPEPRFPVF